MSPEIFKSKKADAICNFYIFLRFYTLKIRGGDSRVGTGLEKVALASALFVSLYVVALRI